MPNLTERCEHGWIDAADQCPDCKKLNALRARVAELEALVRAVESDQYDGIYCIDVEGKNWFDSRDSLLKR